MRPGPITLLVSTVAATAVLTACSSDGPSADAARNRPLLEKVVAGLRADHPELSISNAEYRDSWDKSIALDASCSTCTYGSVVDAVVGAIWTSHIAPLDAIYVDVTVGDRPTRLASFSTTHQRPKLTRMFGPRPADTDPTPSGAST